MKNNLFSTLVVNKNFFKKSLLLVLACCLSYSALGATIYSTDIVESPSGATIAGNKGEFTSAPSWASECSNCFKTTGSAGAITITFDEPLNLSGYNNCQLILTWGAESNRPVNVSVNEGAASEIDKVSSSAERSTVRNAKMDLAVNSISSIKISGSGGGQSYYFHIEIISDGESSGGGDTPGEDPQDEGEPFVQSFSFDNMVSGSDVYDEDNLAIKAKIKFGSDRTNIKPTFKGKNISDNWTPVSADFEANETNTFTFQYTKSGKVKNYEVTITEAEKDPDPVNPPAEGEWLIKGTTQQEVSGPAAGSVETNLSKKDELKLDKKKYFGLILDNGYALQENDVFVINITTAADLGKCVLFADNEGNEVLYDEGIEYSKDEPSATGEKAIVLPAAVAGRTAIYLWREDGATQWNPTFSYIGIKRDGIEVVTVDVTGVKLDQSSISLEEGKSQTLTATVAPADATNKKVTWESSDDAVATVSNGKVTAVAEGTATITVKTDDGDFTATCEVTVTKKSEDPDPELPTGEIYAHWRFSGEEAPANGTFEDGTNIRVEFLSSDDSKSFTVESADYVAGVPDDMKSQGSKGLKNGGNKLYLKASTTNGKGFIAGDVITICGYNPWKISSTSEHTGDISASLATGKSKTEYNIGSVTLTADSKDLFLMRAEGTGTCICAIKVTRDGETPPVDDPVAVTGVSLDKETLELEEGKSQNLSVTIEPSDATNKKVTWESSDDAVATVSNGKVTAVAEGTATITVKTDDGGFTATCKVTVTKSETPPPSDEDCAILIPAGEGDALSVGSQIALNSMSKGGQMVVAGMKTDGETISYNASGLKFSGGKDDIVQVELESQLVAGSVITLNLVSGGTSERGLAILTEEKAEVVSLVWTPSENGEQKSLTYTVSDGDGLAGASKFLLQRKNTVYLFSLTVTGCGGETPPPGEDVAVTGIKIDNSKLSVEEGSTVQISASVLPANATNKNLSYESDDTSVATVDKKGKVTGVSEGTANITVTTEDGGFTANCEITVTKKETPDIPVPETDLALHVPDIYQEKEVAGGYDGTLSVVDGREYEVYYAGRWDNGGTKLTIHVNPVDKSHGITDKETNTSYEAKDGWFKGSGTDKGTGFGAKEEFNQATTRCHTVTSSNSIEMHIKGYDQFSLYAADKKWNPSKPSDCKYFKVSIDDVDQEMTASTDQTIRRFDITTGEHLIKISLVGDGNLFGGFSLRVAQEPRVKYFDGNDSTQKVLQTADIKPIVYFAKYAQMGQVKLDWSGATADGIELETLAQTDLGDTITLSGQANCPVGTYNYAVVTYFGGKETSRATGKFNVISDIKATSDLEINAYTGEEMEQITFRYYALSADDVKVTWPNGQPDGIDGKGKNGIYTIGGTPTTAGEYPFSVTVTGSETVIEGKIKIQTMDIGSNAVLYLYKTNGAEEKDQIFKYLKTQNWNPIARKTIDELRDPEQYGKYQWIYISEDADSDNPEVLALIKGGSPLPIFSVNGFTYTQDRLDWGEPDNGALTKEALYLTVQRNDHPIFKKMGKKQGDSIQVLSNENLGKKGLMPIRVNLPGTHCLATAWTRNINDYNGNGEKQTVLHEIPAKMRGGQKYICLPIAASSTANLTSDGKQLINNIINYLIDESASPLYLPTLQINRFTLGGIDGVIDQAEYTIEVEMTDKQFEELDSLRAATPVITLADPTYSHVVPAIDKEQDFRFSSFIPVVYTVTDFINRQSYAVSLRIKSTQGIDEVYTVGEWVNIFDVYGRKVATTNEDIHSMPLPNGMYIVVTESGQTLKIMR